jgi:hypothetical protein
MRVCIQETRDDRARLSADNKPLAIAVKLAGHNKTGRRAEDTSLPPACIEHMLRFRFAK